MKTKKKIYRIVAIYLLLNMLAEYFIPVSAFALTGGPSQPEVESFEPIGTTEMVDVFTGDFNYNIPLMTVPGPSGGYPINLAYHAGIGMEQEASWVGLGWNINAGVINRMTRGLPDDFKGATIERQYQARENNSLSVGLSGPVDDEYFGMHVGGAYGQLYYNNYKGVGYTAALSLTGQESNALSSHWSKSLTLSLDANAGLGVSPDLSYNKVNGNHMSSFHLSANYTGRDGLNQINLSSERRTITRHYGTRTGTIKKGSGETVNQGTERFLSSVNISQPSSGSGVFFSSGGYVPNVTHPQHGMNLRFALSTGKIKSVPYTFEDTYFSLPPLGSFQIEYNVAPAYTLKPGVNYNASLSLQWADKDVIPYDAYGYLNTQFAGADDMLDFTREKDVPPTKDIPSLPVPVYTYDSYVIKGQGIGGVFRPYRNDVSTLHDPDMGYTIPTLILTGELAANATGSSHWGVGAGVGVTTVQSGDWYGMDHEMTPYYGANTTSTSTPLYEPVFFRSAGDQSENIPFTNYAGGLKPARFDMSFGFAGISLQAKLKNKLVDEDGAYVTPTQDVQKLARDKRNQSIEYFTNAQLSTLNVFPYASARIYTANKFPRFNVASGDSTLFTYNRSSDFPGSGYSDQIGAISVLNPDGNRYYYALPAYNKSQKEVVCSINNTSGSITSTASTAGYGTSNNANNNLGEDRLFSSVKTPAYAHSYLLTAIIGSDYVDITGNGPSDDDLGYWVKFNYSRIDNYNWRVPYATSAGNLNNGYVSNINDDKVSYVYGEKELYYLNSVETKTHLACFRLNDAATEPREDARGVNDENNSTPTSGSRQYFLKKVELFSKRDISANGSSAKSIKTVNLEYDYSLCKQVENNHLSSGDDGKLTLKKVWFSYLGNNKGQLSPYVFDYHATVQNENPNYSLSDMDRWGNYQPNVSAEKLYNSENPYTDQDHSSATVDAARNTRAGAWSLKEITLPSGGKITVEYEADDYAFVQDKRAMQMTKVLGTRTTGSSAVDSVIDKDHLRIVFELEAPISMSDPQATNKLLEYGKGINKLYFKIFEKLKPYDAGNPVGTQSRACDYVEGYADVKYSGGNPVMGYQPDVSGYYYTAWIEVEEEKVTNSVAETRKTHPFRKAGWQYLRMQRPDLFGARNDFGGAMFTLNPVTAAVKAMLSMTQALAGYYNYCWIRGFCKEMAFTPSAGINFRPSFIRLNSSDYVKYGGGHRVKKIKLNDNWATMVDGITPDAQGGHEAATEYGQEFSYTMADGTSAGVAEYEPLVGGEEIPHHLPVPYSSDKFLSNDKALFVEEPYGESMFPPANVGYRRIVVKNLEKTNVTKNREGIKAHEFYTAKEFPVRVDKTEDVLQKKYWLPLPIPFLGSMSFNNRGYSQGYSIELNDMHGKPRSVATYSSNANINDPLAQPVTKIEYIYKTQNPFNVNTANYLDNNVTVLDGDANTRQGELGLITEMYIDKSERYSFNETFNLDPNFDIAGASPVPSFSLVPSLEISEAQFRSAVTVKVIQRTGVLTETRAFDQGSMAVTKNLMFDAQTGVPLLSQVNNNFDKPVYNYKYAGHWAYDAMGHAAKNWGAVFNITVGSAGEANYANAADFFNVGDELINFSTGTRYWVKEVTSAVTPTPDKIKLVLENGTDASAGTYTLTAIRSGRRNQQAITNGTIVSLSNPVTARQFPLFTALTTWFSNSANFATPTFSYNRCVDNQSEIVDIAIHSGTNSLTIAPDNQESCVRIEFADNFIFSSYNQLLGYTFTKMGNDVKVYNATTQDLKWATYVNINSGSSCFEECIPDVLHADVARFTDRWNYFYADLGDPFNGTGAMNDYRAGKRGIWRQETSHLYQVDRKQNDPTKINVDGTYQHFVTYNWGITGSANNRWSLASRTTLYSPFGYALEERDTINVYSSALYGYSNSLATAVSANSQYFESGFDGFEDYGAAYPQTVGSGVLGHGHFLFSTGTSTYPSLGTVAHSGNKSMQVVNGSPVTFATTAVSSYNSLSASTTKFTPIAGKEYAFSCWVKNPAQPYTGTATVTLEVNGSPVQTYTTSKTDVIIEGWHQVNMTIPVLNASDVLEIVISSTAGGNPIYVDDVRIVPFKGAIKTYVYDPVTLWLVAELDNRNFATFYNYDEQGALTQVKKETTNGIITVRSARNNVHQ